jgi:formylglycine-generating enzyme
MTPLMRHGIAALLVASVASSSLGGCSDHHVEPTAPSQVPTATAAVAVEVSASVAPTSSASVTTDACPPPPDPDAGATQGPVEKRACPEGMAQVQRFCIDRFEADLVTKDEDGGWTPLPHNREPPSDVTFMARSVPDVMPQGYINRKEATLACKNAGKRLCSMREWRRTCEGKSGWHWPYGRKMAAGKCNHGKAHLLSIRFGSDARHWTYDNFNDPSLDVEPGFLAKTGAYTDCTTADDVHDLVGNLHEWVSDTVDAALVEKLEAEDVERKSQPWKEGNGVFMGGFFSTADQHGPGCTFTTIAHEPAYHDYSIGFRCCADADLPPPPAKTKKTKKAP